MKKLILLILLFIVLCIPYHASALNMALLTGRSAVIIFDEQFEATGYDETVAGIGSDWVESAGDGSIDEDKTRTDVTGAPASWDGDCLETISSAGDTVIYNTFDSEYTTGVYVRVELIVNAENLGDDQAGDLIILADAGGYDRVMEVQLYESSAVLYLRLKVDSGAATGATAISLDTKYLLEFYYNAAGGWEWKLDSVSKASDVSTANTGVKRILLGPQDNSRTITCYYDNIAVSTEGWIGAQ